MEAKLTQCIPVIKKKEVVFIAVWANVSDQKEQYVCEAVCLRVVSDIFFCAQV